jgi:hypothetical protein
MDTAVRTLPIRTQPIESEPWTPGSKRPATDSPRRGTISPKRSGSAAACLIQLTPAEAAAVSAATGHPAAQPFETEAR